MAKRMDLGSQWYMIKIVKGETTFYKRPFISVPVATSETIHMIAETVNTIEEIYPKIHYDIEAQEIVKAYMDKGFGGYPASLMLR